jgi:hypothetical protein
MNTRIDKLTSTHTVFKAGTGGLKNYYPNSGDPRTFEKTVVTNGSAPLSGVKGTGTP